MFDLLDKVDPADINEVNHRRMLDYYKEKPLRILDIINWAADGNLINLKDKKVYTKKIKKHAFDRITVYEFLCEFGDPETKELLIDLRQNRGRKLFHLLLHYKYIKENHQPMIQKSDDGLAEFLIDLKERYNFEFHKIENGIAAIEFNDCKNLEELVMDLEELEGQFPGSTIVKKLKEATVTHIEEHHPKPQEQKPQENKLLTIGEICALKGWNARILTDKLNAYLDTTEAKKIFTNYIKVENVSIDYPKKKTQTYTASTWINGKTIPKAIVRLFLKEIFGCDFLNPFEPVVETPPKPLEKQEVKEDIVPAHTLPALAEPMVIPQAVPVSQCPEEQPMSDYKLSVEVIMADEVLGTILEGIAKRKNMDVLDVLREMILRESGLADHIIKTAMGLKNLSLARMLIGEYLQ